MKQKFLPLLAVVPLLVVSCKEKSATPVAENTPAAAAKDAPVVLAKRGHLPAAGTKATMESSMEMTDATMQIDAGGQKMDGTATQSMKSKELAEFLADGKIRRSTISKKNTNKMMINGMEQPVPEPTDLLKDKAVLLEKKDGKWIATLEDGSAPGDELAPALEKIAKPFNEETDAAIYGEAPRKIGDKWNADPSKIGSFADMKNLTGTYAIEFVRIEDYQGTPCAVLKSKLDLKGKTAEQGGKSMDMRIRGDATSYRSIKDMTDLQVEITGSLDIDGTPAPNVTIHIEGPIKLIQKATVTHP